MVKSRKKFVSAVAFFLSCPFFNMFAIPRAQQPQKPLKVLVLIICSDDLPVYTELQKIWRSYMHRDREHIEAYFIRGNPQLNAQYKIKGDTIWCKCQECLRPGVIKKTIISMEAMTPRLHEFPYVVRTNLSSFYFFPKLLAYLEHTPKEKFYAAGKCWECPGFSFGEGSSIILSNDLVKFIIKNKSHLIGARIPDDIIIGRFLKKHGIELISHDGFRFFSRADFERDMTEFVNTPHFWFRIKSEPMYRLVDDVYMHKELVAMYYGI